MSKNKKEANNEESFEEISRRLQEIADKVQDEDASLETSIELLEEAVKLGTKATDLIDDERLSDEEKARLQEIANDEAEGDQELKAEEAGGVVPQLDEDSKEDGYISSEDVALHEAKTDADDGKWSPDA